MPATDQLIEHWVGDSKTVTIPVLGPAIPPATLGPPIDLTFAEARWWMGKKVKSTGSDVFIKKSTSGASPNDGGITIVTTTDINNNTIWNLVIVIDPMDTENVKPSSDGNPYYHEAEVMDQNGNVSTVTTGPFILHGTVIREPNAPF